MEISTLESHLRFSWRMTQGSGTRFNPSHISQVYNTFHYAIAQVSYMLVSIPWEDSTPNATFESRAYASFLQHIHEIVGCDDERLRGEITPALVQVLEQAFGRMIKAEDWETHPTHVESAENCRGLLLELRSKVESTTTRGQPRLRITATRGEHTLEETDRAACSISSDEVCQRHCLPFQLNADICCIVS